MKSLNLNPETKLGSCVTAIFEKPSAKPSSSLLGERVHNVGYRPDIDGLRAIAVIAVLLYHAFPMVFPAGFIGVDIFFVISGFLISSIIFVRLRDRSFSFIDFYSRRIRRIFPALLIVLVCVTVFGGPTLLMDERRSLLKEAAAGAAFASNLLRWQEGDDYFNSAAESNQLLHLWSLGVEEQFYILWPMLLWISWKSYLTRVSVIIGICIVSFWLSVSIVSEHPIGAFYSPQTRIWELSIGALLGYAPSLGYSASSTLRSNIFSWLGCGVLLAAFLLVSPERSYPGWWGILPVAGTALVIAGGPTATVNRIFLSHRVVVWFGLISFPLYLWHWPIISFGHVFLGDVLPLLFRLMAVISAVALAWITYHCVEKPIRDGSRTRLQAMTLVVLMGCVGLFSYYRFATDSSEKTVIDIEAGMGTLPYVENAKVFSFSRFIANTSHDACAHLAQGLDFPGAICRVSGHEPSIAVIGDSHALAIYGFVSRAAKSANREMILLGRLACQPFLGVHRLNEPASGRTSCPRAMEAATDFVNRNDKIKDVLLTGWFAVAMNGIPATSPGFKDDSPIRLAADPGITNQGAVFRTGLDSMIEKLTSAGKQVTVVLDVPELDFNPKQCLKHRGENPCTIDKRRVDERQSAYVQVVRDLQKKYQFKILDLKSVLCGTTDCSAKDGDYVLYMDYNHLGINGNIRLINSGLGLSSDALTHLHTD